MIRLLEDISQFLYDHLGRPPFENCSCHINPPCSDCINNSEYRELADRIDKEILKLEEDKKS